MGRLAFIAALVTFLAACSSAPIAADIPRGAAAYQNFPTAANAEASKAYRLGPLDTVNIVVFEEPELSTAPGSNGTAIDASGNLAMPLVGSIRAAGKTADELAADIAHQLGRKYLVRPQVSVTVVSSVSQKITVQGEVTEPGVYEIKGPTTLLEAIALAKGESKVAKLREVVVFRTVNGQRYGGLFDVASIRRGVAQDPQVRGNDIVVVGISHAKTLWRDVVSATPILNVMRPLGF